AVLRPGVAPPAVWTLLPYTTLFRSGGDEEVVEHVVEPARAGLLEARGDDEHGRRGCQALARGGPLRRRTPCGGGRGRSAARTRPAPPRSAPRRTAPPPPC